MGLGVPATTSLHCRVCVPQDRSGRTKKKKQVKVLNLDTWNVQTLLDNTKADRPERRTALVAKELARYNVDIATLSETRFADKGQLTEHSGGYTFFWSGRSTTERREAGVGFAIRSHLARKLAKLQEGINDRLMSLQLPLENKKSVTLISAYTPTMTNPEDIKDKFYEELDVLIAAVPQSEKLFILGDFNARVGPDHQTWEGIIGRHGTGKCNSNGLLLHKLCATHDLTLTNTLFRLPTRNKTTWMHPRFRHVHLIDYVITRKRDVQDVRVTRAMCGADCWTDHHANFASCQSEDPKARRVQRDSTSPS
ncbi:craniofacial development protein 2-like [Penaeus chinensis]|uniref:craniofacial development protein 2-like n=1 Tax=Penaeus chinensis TaxID=139456 RepID=UPI001FB6DB3D|nr:craniofacial development protein 2-like [Penaeus chinensis]